MYICMNMYVGSNLKEKRDNSKQSEAFFQTIVAVPVRKSTLTYWLCVFKHIAICPVVYTIFQVIPAQNIRISRDPSAADQGD